MRASIPAAVLLPLLMAVGARAQEAPLRARGVPALVRADSFRTAHGTMRMGVTAGGEVALRLEIEREGRMRWPEERFAIRDWVEPDSVLAWVERARPAPEPPPVGSEALRIRLPEPLERGEWAVGHFGVGGCRWAGASVNHQAYEGYVPLLDLLRQNAEAARDLRSGEPADGDMPYWAHAVSCPAVPLGPAPVDEDAPRLVARFVVGTDGRPEPGTLALLPGTPPGEADALRRVLRDWRFTPAIRGGRAVRQVVFTLVSPRVGDRSGAPRRQPPHRVAAADGVVEVRVRDGREPAAPERGAFFTPGEVATWLRAVEARRFPAFLGGDPERRGLARRSTVVADTLVLAGGPRLRVYVQRCDGGGGTSDTTLVSRLREAAARARPGRAQAAADRAYPPDEVDCRARPDPANPLPRADPGESAELHAAFVVDARGAVEPGSLRTMPGSDPRLEHALAAVLGRWRFEPATRLGRPVRQSVPLAVVFGHDGTAELDPR